MTDAPSPEFVAAVEAAGLLRDEYPDQMAARSCTCTPDAMCGAHRLLDRYEALYEHLRDTNSAKRDLRAAVAAANQRAERAEAVAANLTLALKMSPDQRVEAAEMVVRIIGRDNERLRAAQRAGPTAEQVQALVVGAGNVTLATVQAVLDARLRALLADQPATGESDQPSPFKVERSDHTPGG